jgi:hypothetical protein
MEFSSKGFARPPGTYHLQGRIEWGSSVELFFHLHPHHPSYINTASEEVVRTSLYHTFAGITHPKMIPFAIVSHGEIEVLLPCAYATAARHDEVR